MSDRPNILWICTDQQRFDTIRALGNERIRTPHIDRLVAGGVAFTQAYCQSPVCTPSRASFLTGRYPRTTRCRQNGQSMPEAERLLPRILADHGYDCGLSGKLHLASCSDGKVEQRIDDGYRVFHWSHHPQPDWPENAYTQWLVRKGLDWKELYAGPEVRYVKEGIPAEHHQTTWCGEMAIDFIREHANDSQPWLFSVNPFAPHHPFDPPAEYLARYHPEEMPLPRFRPGELDNKPQYQRLDHHWAHNNPGGMDVASLTPAESQRITAAYYAMIEHIDHEVGRMLDALEESGQRENTLVVFMSDHGEMLGDHGLYLKGPHFYDEAVHVPLVISWPGHIASGLRSDALVELTDLAPTLMECCGLTPEPQMQGRSLHGILSGRSDPHRHRASVLCEYYNSWTHSRSYGTMLRTRTEKIVVYHGTERGELYDLATDPDEFDNLWDVPAAQLMKSRLLKDCFDASVFTLDPLPERRGLF
ncbi:MAG: sulfatase-like hydrolase/transferase [Planctomycetaceae bacterium]|nr:sulfatase-like hydrolase/transferase [Planctomycetaceae bacterium]